MRVAEIVRDIIRQDPNTPIVVCGDFNNHMAYIVEQLGYLSFTAAVDPSTARAATSTKYSFAT